MNAYQLSARLRERRQQLEAASDWIPSLKQRARLSYGVPAVRLTFHQVYINRAGFDALGLSKDKDWVAFEYSPGEKVLRISPAQENGGYSIRPGKAITARAIYQQFGLVVPPVRDTPEQEPHLYRPALVIGKHLLVDVSDLVQEAPAS